MNVDTAGRDIDAWQTQVVRRLCRLFQIERAGRFERCAPAMVQQLIARREKIIDNLIAAETQRRREARDASSALLAAVTELASEVEKSHEPAAAKLRRLEAELRPRSALRVRSGLRDSAGGRLLGSG